MVKVEKIPGGDDTRRMANLPALAEIERLIAGGAVVAGDPRSSA